MDEQNTGADMGSNMQDMETQPAQEMHEHHHGAKGIIWSIVVLVVLVLAVWGLMRFVSPDNEIGDGQYLDTAAAGQVIDGFPEAFLIEEEGSGNMELVESFRVRYEKENAELLVVRYMSGISLLDNRIGFGRVLSDGGWAVSAVPAEELAAMGDATSYQASKDGERVDITFRNVPDVWGRLEVTVAYSQTTQ